MNTMRLICLCLLFSGCAALDPYKAQAVDVIAKANDRAVEDAELVDCRGASRGNLMRKFLHWPAGWKAWLTLCGYDADTANPAPILPEHPAP